LLNFPYYTHSDEPAIELSRHGIQIPQRWSLIDWASDEYVTYSCSRSDAEEIASIVDQIFVRFVGTSENFKVATKFELQG